MIVRLIDLNGGLLTARYLPGYTDRFDNIFDRVELGLMVRGSGFQPRLGWPRFRSYMNPEPLNAEPRTSKTMYGDL